MFPSYDLENIDYSSFLHSFTKYNYYGIVKELLRKSDISINEIDGNSI